MDLTSKTMHYAMVKYCIVKKKRKKHTQKEKNMSTVCRFSGSVLVACWLDTKPFSKFQACSRTADSVPKQTNLYFFIQCSILQQLQKNTKECTGLLRPQNLYQDITALYSHAGFKPILIYQIPGLSRKDLIMQNSRVLLRHVFNLAP